MSVGRKKMINALVEELVPELRRRGFVGVFPHFKRTTLRAHHLLMVQFKRTGGAFLVEIAAAPLIGLRHKRGWTATPDRLTVVHAERRLRLGAANEEQEREFDYRLSLSEPAEDCREIASSVISFIETQAEPWWRKAEQEFAP